MPGLPCYEGLIQPRMADAATQRRPTEANLQAQLAMRPQSHQLEGAVVRESVDQDEIGLDVAVAVVCPLAYEWVISVLWG